MTAESEDNFKKFLDRHSVKAGYQNYYIREEGQGEGRGEQVEKHSESKYADLSHMLIVRKYIGQGVTYELSLFGIMFVIAVIRYHPIGIDKVRYVFLIYMLMHKSRLFFEDIPLEEYFDKIALNYHDKLPLIFGKWSLLKKELGSLFFCMTTLISCYITKHFLLIWVRQFG